MCCLSICRRLIILMQSTTFEAAKDVAAFFAIFFEHFSQYRGRPLHMAGESYAVSPLHRGS